MFDVTDDNLPSVQDFTESVEHLPSVSDFIEELPSVEDFLEPLEEEVKEEVIEEELPEPVDLTEIVRLINDVRKDIPDVPEIKSYDGELEQIISHIHQLKESIPEVKYYDEDITAIKEDIENIPEIRYYEEDVEALNTKITSLKEELSNLPEIRHYEKDLESLKEHLEEVANKIPTFPRWVNEVNEVPDFSWIGKTFSVIDDDFVKVQDNFNFVKGKIDTEVQELTELIDTKNFETKVDINLLNENLEKTGEKLKETKDQIYKELREASVRLWNHHSQFQDDDRKLKKQILSKLNETKQNIEKQIKELPEIRHYEEDIDSLKEDINNLPEIKYYDQDITQLREDITPFPKELEELRKMVIELKAKQYKFQEVQDDLQEGFLNQPPDTKTPDPLTPLDQKFVTFGELAKHYRLFVNRVQETLATYGGGGAIYFADLDDVERSNVNGNGVEVAGRLVMYDGNLSKWVGIASTSVGSNTLTGLSDVDDANLGDGRFLRYDASSEEFTFTPVSATNLELIAGDIQGGILTTTSTSAASVMPLSASEYRSVSYQVQVTEGTNYNMTTINIIHDGTSTYMNEYGTINQPVGIATFGADINSGTLRLLGYPASTNTTTFKTVVTALQL